jgi:hypothetical protein
MWEWWDSDYRDAPHQAPVSSPEQFRDTLELEVIRFEPGDDAYLVYADHGLVDGYGIHIHVSPTGRFTRGPHIG